MSGITLGAVAAVVSAAAGIYSAVSSSNAASDAGKKQEEAIQQNKVASDKQLAQADQDFNRAHQKKPDTSAILSAAQQSGKGGASGTMLTGAQGVDPNQLALGKSTLLGQ